MKRHFTYLFIFLFFFTACSLKDNKKGNRENQQKAEKTITEKELIVGERIDGPANIRKEINGKLLFILKDGTPVQTGLIENNWFPVGLWIDIDKEQETSFRLLPGQKILRDGIEIGQVIDTTVLWTADNGAGFIAGMTFKDNIVSSTIPEVQLATLIKQEKVSIHELKPFMDALKFEQDHSWLNSRSLK